MIADVSLKIGEYKAEINTSDSATLAKNQDWQKIDVEDEVAYFKYIQGVSALQEADLINDVNYLTIKDSDGVTDYNLILDTLVTNGNVVLAVIEETHDKSFRQVLLEEFATSDVNKRIDIKFSSSVASNNLHIYVFSYSDSLIDAKYDINHFSLRKDNKPILIIEKTNQVDKKNTIPNIKFKRINPTKFKVYIDNVSQPFDLVFNQSYHSGWKVFLDTKTEPPLAQENRFFDKNIIEYFRKNAIAEENHKVANGFANSWHIDPKGLNTFTLTIEFIPQWLFYLGLFITFVSLIALTILFVFSILWSKRKSRKI
ncbi:MAG: hypothetical protein A2122_01810 [Candidatus Liptonbacteria bacterium GWB1_49_6]|uniref:Uncharacterized protein n=1 Tax=Candidatus Liptonbacteria bacterium GWB1_49_6 TaxID=1798644 RepID=A0A1G2C651_9BACT|nr:MAG: hypothetical protein A2122_01810 [Candidatus Liptonbacteria bacterium GWB1_49_6]